MPIFSSIWQFLEIEVFTKRWFYNFRGIEYRDWNRGIHDQQLVRPFVGLCAYDMQNTLKPLESIIFVIFHDSTSDKLEFTQSYENRGPLNTAWTNIEAIEIRTLQFIGHLWKSQWYG